VALKACLGTGRPAVGCWLHLFSPLAAEVVAQAGYDCVMIDLEHGAGSLMDAISLMHAVQGRDCTPLIRVPANDPVWIKRALDTGVAGVMVPAINDAAEAASAVASCRYPPQGRRGVAPTIVRASAYGADWRDYIARAAGDLLVIGQIESAAGVRNAAEIAAVEGLDMVFVGPFDLSAAVGRMGEPDHPEVRSLIEQVEQAAKAAGKGLGGIPTPDRTVEALFAAGYDLVLADFDVLLLRDAARGSVARLRNAMGPATKAPRAPSGGGQG
jgi:2-keto-3-deoxy-L-rhamnonate aldolase RhmA